MSSVSIRTVSGNKDLMAFIKFPWKIYKNDPYWVPPLIIERKELLDQKKNPFFQHSEIELFLAYKGNDLVGRIAAITNQNHNDFQEDNNGFFGFYESTNDEEVATALFDAARAWLKNKGKSGMFGPMNPSTNDEAGLLIDGFDSPPFVMMCHNPRYYMQLFENQGLKKAKDLWAWYRDIRNFEIPEKLLRVAEKTKAKYDVSIRNIKLKNIKKEIELIREVYNDAWEKNWGFVPMTRAEFDHIAANLKQIANEEYLLLMEKDGRPIGFSVTLPNINEILINIKDGKLFPTGIFKLLTGMKKIQAVRVLTLGVIKEYQTAGLGSLFYIESIKRAKKNGIIGGEMSWILEDNAPMNRAIELLGSTKHKSYRIYHEDFA